MDSVRLACALLFAFSLGPKPGTAPDAGNSLKIINPVFSVDASGSSASLVLILRNASSKPIDLSLDVTDFTSKSTGHLLGTKSTIDAVIKSVPAHNASAIKIDFTNLGEAGESEATLLNHGETVGKLTAQRFAFPFAISLETDPEQTITLSSSSGGVLKFKNDDQLTYAIDWVLSVPGEMPVQGHTTLYPKTTVSEAVTVAEGAGSNTISKEWFGLGLRGLLRDSIQNATLTVRYQDPTDKNKPLVQREFPVKLKLKKHGDDLQRFLTYLLVFIMLGLGGFSSLYMNFAVPNRLKQIDLKEKLAVLASRISAISIKIDSRLRVALRLERQRLKSMLSSRKIYSPDLTDVFSRLGIGLDLLTRRIELSEQLDGLRRQFRGSHGLPTSCVDQIDVNLQAAADSLRKNYVGETDLDKAKAALAKAESLFAPPQQLTDDLAKRITAITDALDPNQPLGKLQATLPLPLPKIFAANNVTYKTPANISASIYTDLDNSACRLELWIQYLKERNGKLLPLEKSFAIAETRLWKYLDTNSWDSFAMARIVLREMQEQTYPEELAEALRNSQAKITLDRQVARVYQPLEFYICFDEPRFDLSAAAEEFTAKWDFGDGMTENSWVIWHYYQDEKEMTVTTSSFRQIGAPVIMDPNGPKGKKLELEKVELDVKTEEKNRLGERGKTELVRLLVALFVAVVGLIAGANQQLAKLDILPGLIAVFVVGFSADSIKNILLPPSTKS